MSEAGRRLWGAAFLAAAILTIGGVQAARAVQQNVSPVAMSALDNLPTRVGAWTLAPTPDDAVSPSELDDKGQPIAIYDKIVSRTYRRTDGSALMLMVAYKLSQHQEDRVHRPELCYYAQGYVIRDRAKLPVVANGANFHATRFVADGLERREQVLYWIRTGDLVSTSAWRERGDMFLEGLRGRIPDGALVRASLLSAPGSPLDLGDGDRKLKAFATELLASASPATRSVLAGVAG